MAVRRWYVDACSFLVPLNAESFAGVLSVRIILAGILAKGIDGYELKEWGSVSACECFPSNQCSARHLYTSQLFSLGHKLQAWTRL